MGLFSFAKKLVDPGGFVFKSDSQKLAEKQYSTEKDIAEKNYDEQVRMNNENIRMQQEAFDYQKGLNAMQMEREDTAVQRRINDLKASGLSPTLAAGSAASATPVHAGTAPQGVAPQMATPSDVKVQEAMFRESLAKDRMALAMSVLSNMADVSRTKAETELIRAQKDRYVAETPIELRLKTLEQEFRSGTLESRIIQEVEKATQSQLETYNKVLTNLIDENRYGREVLEFVLRSKFGERQEDAKTNKLEKEVEEKTLAVKLMEHINTWEEDNGVPISAMSPVAKTFWPLSKKSAQNLDDLPNSSHKGWLFGKSWDWWHQENPLSRATTSMKKKTLNFLHKVTGNAFNGAQ